MAKPGRPSDYTPELADRICKRISEGESVRSICSDETMPSKATVFRWLGDDRKIEFRARYAGAHEAQAEAICDEILEIADDATNDFMDRKRGDGSIERVLNSEHVQRSRLRIDSRKWLLSKMLPKKYGDRLELSGKDGAPVIPVINVTIGGSDPAAPH